MNRQGTLARSEYPQHLGWLASQDMGPVLTMLALLALRAVLHSSRPRLTRHGTCFNYACPPGFRASCTPPDLAFQDMGPVLTMLALRVCPLHLHVNLGWETVFHDDLMTLVLYILVEHH